jgi:hypothetical protein
MTGVSNGDDQTTAALRDDIATTRKELGDTVEALARKTDVKARAAEAVDEAKRRPIPIVGVIAAVLAVLLAIRWVGRRKR